MRIYSYIKNFQCLGANCEDTCCRGWGMQLDSAHKKLYETTAPELLNAIISGEAEFVMKRDPETDYCVKFDNGLCTIHRDLGSEFLGDACHFYPRISRLFGDQILQSAALSCPEIVRMALFTEDAFSLTEKNLERVPVELKDYLPKELDYEGAVKIISTLIDMASDASLSPERIMARIITIAASLQNTAVANWSKAIDFLIKMADGRLPKPEPRATDNYHIVQILAGLIYASKKSNRPRLEETFSTMEKALGISIDKETLEIKLNPHKQLNSFEGQRDVDKRLDTILRRWIQAELAMANFPFAGFGNNLSESATILGVRFATVKLALMSYIDAEGHVPDENTTIRIVQSLSRFMDHLAAPELSIKLYKEVEWNREPRMRALIGDA